MAISKLVSLGRIGLVVEGEFDSTKEYKNLSVVKVPSTGSVYISKKAVPKNTSVGNEEYWMKVFAGELSTTALQNATLPQLSTLSEREYVNVIEISSSLLEYNLFIKVNTEIDDINNVEGSLYGNSDADRKKVWVYNSQTGTYVAIFSDITTIHINDILITEVNENSITYNTNVIRSSVLDNLNNTELSSRINGFIVHSIPSYDNTNTLKLKIGKKVDINTIGGVLFKVPEQRDGFNKIKIFDYQDELITTVTLTGTDILFGGDIYIIIPTIEDRVWTGATLKMLHRNDKVINSKACVTIDQADTVVINGLSNVRTTGLDNVEYVFDCINTECDIDLFSMLALDDGFGSADPLETLNVESYNTLLFTSKLKFIFHIASYYKNVDTPGGKYHTGTGYDRNVGSYFSGQKQFNENTLRTAIPQFWGRSDINLTQFVIPRNTKFTIVLLPMLNCLNGTIDSDSGAPYSMIILFDAFDEVVKYNNSGDAGTPTDAVADVVNVTDKPTHVDISTTVVNNVTYTYAAEAESYIKLI